MITVSAWVKLRPRPPAFVDRRNTLNSGKSKLSIIYLRFALEVDPSILSDLIPLKAKKSAVKFNMPKN